MDGFIDNIRTPSTHGCLSFEGTTPTISPIYSGNNSRISIALRINKTSRGDPYHPYAPFSLSDLHMDGFIDNIRTLSTHGFFAFERKTPTISPIYNGKHSRISIMVRIYKTSWGDPYDPLAPYHMDDFIDNARTLSIFAPFGYLSENTTPKLNSHENLVGSFNLH